MHLYTHSCVHVLCVDLPYACFKTGEIFPRELYENDQNRNNVIMFASLSFSLIMNKQKDQRLVVFISRSAPFQICFEHYHLQSAIKKS